MYGAGIDTRTASSYNFFVATIHTRHSVVSFSYTITLTAESEGAIGSFLRHEMKSNRMHRSAQYVREVYFLNIGVWR